MTLAVRHAANGALVVGTHAGARLALTRSCGVAALPRLRGRRVRLGREEGMRRRRATFRRGWARRSMRLRRAVQVSSAMQRTYVFLRSPIPTTRHGPARGSAGSANRVGVAGTLSDGGAVWPPPRSLLVLLACPP